jgi:hypothetical protein
LRFWSIGHTAYILHGRLTETFGGLLSNPGDHN